MYQDKSKYNYIGNGKLDAIQMAELGFTDAEATCINLASDSGFIAGEDPKKAIKKQSYKVEPTGGANSTVLLTLMRYMVDETGAALASGTTVTIGGTEYTCTTGGVIEHEIDGSVYDTLHDFVAAINAIPGFKASILNALTTKDMDVDDFIAVSETVLADVAAGGVDTLKQDVSALFTAVLRLGIPRANDRGPMQLLSVKGTSTGVTSGTVKLIRDDDGEYVAGGSHQETYVSDTLLAANTEYVGNTVLDGETIRGPVCLVVSSDDLSALSMSIKYRQALANM